jgi:serine/threonine-protein kinase RsbW/stage II sporulation protein AB (anti-sigma F factor)
MTLDMPAQPQNVARARSAVRRLAEQAGFPPQRSADVVLAVGEACANAVMHAYVDAGAGPLRLEGRIDHGVLLISVVDRGRGIVPRPDSPGAGFGLPLVAALATKVELLPVAGGGTEVRMRFDA